MSYEDKEIDKKFEDINSKIESKVDKDTLSKVIGYGIAAVVAFATSILGLYILYYSGLTELKVDMKGVQKDISQIKQTLKIADIDYEN